MCDLIGVVMKKLLFCLMCCITTAVFSQEHKTIEAAFDTLPLLTGTRLSYQIVENEHEFYDLSSTGRKELNTKGYVKQTVRYDLTSLGIAQPLIVTICYDAQNPLPYMFWLDGPIVPSLSFDTSKTERGYDKKLRCFVFTMTALKEYVGKRFNIQICL